MNVKTNVVPEKKQRQSNLELLRIILMFIIVAHHSVVNSEIVDCFDFSTLSLNMIFLQLWGMWGKTAINAFVLITGYFMCTSKLTWKKFLKLFLQVEFYSIVIFMIFLFTGYENLNLKTVFRIVFRNVSEINVYFIGSFFAFYLLIPFLNSIIKSFGRNLWKLILALLALFTIIGTFFLNDAVFHEVFWYCTLYFVAAWFRLYPNRFTESKRFTGIVLFSSVILAYLSVIGIDILGYILKRNFSLSRTYYFVSNSNKIFAFIIGVSVFLFFKKLNIKQSKIINEIAATTFGVLCIHANSDAMRQWLWGDFFHIKSLYNKSTLELVVIMIGIAIIVFIVCSFLDRIRICYIEKPLFQWIDKHTDEIDNRIFIKISKISRYGKKLKNKLVNWT